MQELNNVKLLPSLALYTKVHVYSLSPVTDAALFPKTLKIHI